MPYAKALKKSQYRRRDDHPQKSRVFCAGGGQRVKNERLTHRVMFGMMAVGQNLGHGRPRTNGMMAVGQNSGHGRPRTNWVQCLIIVDDLTVFRGAEGTTEKFPLLCGVETVLWPTAANMSGN